MTTGVFGRDAELATLEAFLDSVPGSPGALVLAGPAGAGKTTLVRVVMAQATARGFAVLHTMPARGEVKLAFAGLADLLEPYLHTFSDALPGPQARALRVALLIDDADGHPPEPRVIAAAFRSALGLLAQAAPVLVVVDDVQWLDAATAAAVAFAARRLEHEPVGLLCAQRTSRPGEDLPLELGRARQQPKVVPVGALSLGALHRLLRTRLGTSFSHPALRRIEAASGGNAFISLEIGRALARRDSGDGRLASLPVPSTLAGLVGERMGELSAATLSAVDLVAVMPDAPVGSYQAAGVDGAELDSAVLAGVLEIEAGRLRFTHPLLAATVSAGIPPVRLRALHATAARHTGQAESRARHRALATAGHSEPVAAEVELAAQAAAARGAPVAAAELFDLAASLTPDEFAAHARRRRLGAARQLATGGETRAARLLLEQLAAAAPPGPERADALCLLGSLHSEDADGIALLEQALAETGNDPGRRSGMHSTLSDICAIRGDAPRALAEARTALAEAERADDQAMVTVALATVFERACLAGADPDEVQLERAMELERQLADVPLTWSPSHIAGIHHARVGLLERAEQELRCALAHAEDQGLESWRADILPRLTRIALRRGDVTAATALAADALTIAEQLDLPRPMCAALYTSAGIALQQGDAEALRDLAQRGSELAERSGDRPYAVLCQALSGSLDLALGDYSAAASRLVPLAGQLAEIGWHPPTQGIAPDVAEAMIAHGDLDEVERLLSALERAMRDPVTAALVARCRGAAAAARGDLAAAEDHLAVALARHGEVSPMPVEIGRTLLVLGGVQRRMKQRAAARSMFSQAVELFEAAGAVVWAERARAELRRISGRQPGPVRLSETESRVVRLVARGLSNREAAAELFVTVRAVESTLTKAYAKLGVRSRTELAAWMHGAGEQGGGGTGQ
jgi:DNA-binding CsgD family transcriptional regulator